MKSEAEKDWALKALKAILNCTPKKTEKLNMVQSFINTFGYIPDEHTKEINQLMKQ